MKANQELSDKLPALMVCYTSSSKSYRMKFIHGCKKYNLRSRLEVEHCLSQTRSVA